MKERGGIRHCGTGPHAALPDMCDMDGRYPYSVLAEAIHRRLAERDADKLDARTFLPAPSISAKFDQVFS